VTATRRDDTAGFPSLVRIGTLPSCEIVRFRPNDLEDREMAVTEARLDGRVLEEYLALEYILLGDLRDVLEEPADEESRKWLLAILDALLDAMPREFELKCRGGGYLCEVLEQYPNWYPEVENLKEERGELYSHLRRLQGCVRELFPADHVAARVRRELHSWMKSFIAHHRHERRLFMNAFTMEVGCGD
jgi:hypothetical protein